MRKPCCEEQENIKKGAWSKQEDQKLIDFISLHGEGCWRSLPKAAGLQRCGKSCRLRWINYLKPDIKRGNFGEDEEDLVIKLHALLGNRWSLIAGRLPGRTDNEIKNYWNSHVKRKLLEMGINPNNHRLDQYPPTRKNHNEKPPKPRTLSRVSDSTSEAATSGQLNLNLDLTIAITPSNSLTSIEEKTKPASKSMMEEENEGLTNEATPTLQLFR